MKLQSITENMRRKQGPSPRDTKRGAVFVEFAMCFILFVMMALGITEFGRLLWSHVTLANAVRQGTRYARVHGEGSPVSDDQIARHVSDSGIGLAARDLSTTVEWLPDNQRGSRVRIRSQYTLRLLAGSLLFHDGSITLESASTIVIAN